MRLASRLRLASDASVDSADVSQQPFSRPGAFDLSSLASPPSGASGGPRGQAAGTGAAGEAAGSPYAVRLDEQNFQSVLETSMTAPVILVFFSPSRMPESAGLADDFVTLSAEFEGKFLTGLVDIDVAPAIAQAMQVDRIDVLASRHTQPSRGPIEVQGPDRIVVYVER